MPGTMPHGDPGVTTDASIPVAVDTDHASQTIKQRPHWRRALVLLWMGQIISHLGDSLYLVGIVWLVLDLTGSKSLTGWLVGMNFAPALVLGLFAGAIVGRHARRRMMIGADAFRFLAVGAIPLLSMPHHLTAPVLGELLVALPTGTTFFNTAITA